jgi:hypothetical protein
VSDYCAKTCAVYKKEKTNPRFEKEDFIITVTTSIYYPVANILTAIGCLFVS